jgi:hypothetical protein
MFVGVAGVFAYLLRAALSAIFVVSVPMAPDWCASFAEVYVSPDLPKQECSVYKDGFEKAKSEHNRLMLSRNKYLLVVEFSFWLAITGVVFYWLPKWKGLQTPHGEEFILLGIIAFLVSIILPMVLSLSTTVILEGALATEGPGRGKAPFPQVLRFAPG